MWDIDRGEARELLAGLIGIDSVNPSLVAGGAGELEAAQYIVNYLHRQGISARLEPVVDGRPNAIAALPATRDAKGSSSPFEGRHGLIVNGHLDTVSCEGMTRPPFVAQFIKDKVYGRGSYDMKGGLVIAMLALAAVKRSGRRLQRSVLFTGVMDEEYASLGTQSVVERYQADAAIILEPTGLTVHLAHKGFAWVAVETFGRAAHGSRPQEGIDAITQMGKLLAAVEGLERRYEAEQPHPLVGRRSIHASLIQGGREMSTYPDRCVCQLERRTLPGEDPTLVAYDMEDLCSRLADDDPAFKARVTLGLTRRGYEIAPSAGIVQATVSAYRAVTQKDPEYAGSGPWLDSAILGQAGIPTVIFGPDGAGAHAAEEYLSFRSVLTGAEVLAELIMQWCG